MATKEGRSLGAALFPPRDGRFPTISPVLVLPGLSTLPCNSQRNPRDAPDDSADAFIGIISYDLTENVEGCTKEWKDLAAF